MRRRLRPVGMLSCRSVYSVRSDACLPAFYSIHTMRRMWKPIMCARTRNPFLTMCVIAVRRRLGRGRVQRLCWLPIALICVIQRVHYVCLFCWLIYRHWDQLTHACIPRYLQYSEAHILREAALLLVQVVRECERKSSSQSRVCAYSVHKNL